MPHKPENYSTVPVCIEPSIKDSLEKTAKEKGFSRTKFLRMMVKYVLTHKPVLQDIIAYGDPPPSSR